MREYKDDRKKKIKVKKRNSKKKTVNSNKRKDKNIKGKNKIITRKEIKKKLWHERKKNE